MPDEPLYTLTRAGRSAILDCPGNVTAFPSTSPSLTAQERAEVELFSESVAPAGITIRIGEFGTGGASPKHDKITVLGGNGHGAAAHIFRPSGTPRFLVVDLLSAAQVTQHDSIADALASAAQQVLTHLTATAA